MEALLRSFIHLAGAAARRCSAVVPEVHLAQDLLLVEVAARASAYGPHSPAFAKAVGYISSAWSHQDLVMHQFFVTAATKSKAAIASSPSYSLLQGSGAKNAISLSCTRSAGLPYGFSNVALGKMPPVNVMSPTGIQSVVYWKGASFAGAARLWPGPTSLFAQSIQASPISQVKRRVGPHSMLLLASPIARVKRTLELNNMVMARRFYSNQSIGGSSVRCMKSGRAVNLLSALPLAIEARIKEYNSMLPVDKLVMIALVVSLSTASFVGYSMYQLSCFKSDLSVHVESLVDSAKVDLACSVNEEIRKSAKSRAKHAEFPSGTSKPPLHFSDCEELMEFFCKLLQENEELKELHRSMGTPSESTAT